MGQFPNSAGYEKSPAEVLSELHVPEAWNIRSEIGASKKGTVPIFFQPAAFTFLKCGSILLK